jgi:hypothetical protein
MRKLGTGRAKRLRPDLASDLETGAVEVMGSDLETAAVKEGAGNSNVAAGSARFEKPAASGLKLARIYAKLLPLNARRTKKSRA